MINNKNSKMVKECLQTVRIKPPLHTFYDAPRCTCSVLSTSYFTSNAFDSDDLFWRKKTVN